MHKATAYILIVLFILISACEKETQWNFKSEELNLLIVDCIITNELKPQEIILSRSYSDLNDEPEIVTGAQVWVADSNTVYPFTESTDYRGHYYSASFRAVVNRWYMLQVVLDGDTFNAYARAVPVSPNNNIEITAIPDSALYRYVYQGQDQASMTMVDYDWSANAEYCQQYGSCRAREIYYTLSNTDVNEVFKPDADHVAFPSGTIIIQKKYSLSEEHQKFLRSLLIETEWSGGVFDVQHGNIPSNISNGALGFFGVSMVVSDSLLVD